VIDSNPVIRAPLATIAGGLGAGLKATKPCGRPLTDTASNESSKRNSRSTESAADEPTCQNLKA
jgi:hypothetical protein